VIIQDLGDRTAERVPNSPSRLKKNWPPGAGQQSRYWAVGPRGMCTGRGEARQNDRADTYTRTSKPGGVDAKMIAGSGRGRSSYRRDCLHKLSLRAEVHGEDRDKAGDGVARPPQDRLDGPTQHGIRGDEIRQVTDQSQTWQCGCMGRSPWRNNGMGKATADLQSSIRPGSSYRLRGLACSQSVGQSR